MVFFQIVSGISGGRLFSLGLLMLTAVHYGPLITGQQGVSLKLRGVTIPNNSLLDLDDILYRAPDSPGQNESPTNAQPDLHDVALLCVTDLEDCCDAPCAVRGNWYYPGGQTAVPSSGSDNFIANGPTSFLSNRGPNEVRNGRQFYGSVRLFRRWNNPPERGRFRCEIPSAANPSVNQILYVNIVNIWTPSNTGSATVILSPSGSGIAGNFFTLTCSATLLEPIPLPSDVPSPSFEWFYGPHSNASLPSGVTPSSTVLMSGNIYSSTLQFLPSLKESHAGMYTCRLGAGRLVNSIMVSVDAPSISIQVSKSTSGSGIAGESFALTCRVLGAENLNPSITHYQWFKNSNGDQIQVGTNSTTLSFATIRLSDAANYSCAVTITSHYLTSSITAVGSQTVTVQIPPSSVSLTSNVANSFQIVGSDVLLTCTIKMNSAILGSEILLLAVGAQLSKEGTSLTLDGSIVDDTTVTYTAQLNSFQKSDFGRYVCTAIVSPHPSSTYITGNDTLSDTINIEPVLPPPIDVRATQSSLSAPVEVSWSTPPVQGGFEITGYRIFYGSGPDNVSIPSMLVASVSFRVNGSYDGQIVSIRSESNQPYSELVNVTVESHQPYKNNEFGTVCDMVTCSYVNSCSKERGTAIGAVALLMVIIAVIIILIVMSCWWRKKSSAATKDVDIDISVNAAYEGVIWKSSKETEDPYYESPDYVIIKQLPEKKATAASFGLMEPLTSEYKETMLGCKHHSTSRP